MRGTISCRSLFAHITSTLLLREDPLSECCCKRVALELRSLAADIMILTCRLVLTVLDAVLQSESIHLCDPRALCSFAVAPPVSSSLPIQKLRPSYAFLVYVVAISFKSQPQRPAAPAPPAPLSSRHRHQA